jgi:hypothetical protein
MKSLEPRKLFLVLGIFSTNGLPGQLLKRSKNMGNPTQLVVCEIGLEEAVQTEYNRPYTVSIQLGDINNQSTFGLSANEELERALELLSPKIVTIVAGSAFGLEEPGPEKMFYPPKKTDDILLPYRKMIETVKREKPNAELEIIQGNKRAFFSSPPALPVFKLGVTCADHRLDTSMFDVVFRSVGGYAEGQVPFILNYLKLLGSPKVVIHLLGHTDCACEKFHLSEDQRDIGYYQLIMKSLLEKAISESSDLPFELEIRTSVRKI